MWETRAEEGLFSIYCLDCGTKLIGDAERGEQVCPKCGSVTNAREDEGPEWKAVDLEEKNKRVRVGSPTTLTLHDLGLSTDISMEMRDSHGKYLDPAMRDGREDEEVAEPHQDEQQPGARTIDSARKDHRGLRQPLAPEERRRDRSPHLPHLGQA